MRRFSNRRREWAALHRILRDNDLPRRPNCIRGGIRSGREWKIWNLPRRRVLEIALDHGQILAGRIRRKYGRKQGSTEAFLRPTAFV
nr:hypothetical protein [Cressdnaviricota sp.]